MSLLTGERGLARAPSVKADEAEARRWSPASTPDEDLVVAALADRRSFWLLYDRYLDRIHSYARSQLRSEVDADDVVADTMLAAFEHLERFDPEKGAFSTWLFTIARRKVIDHGRAHRRLWRLATRQQAFVSGIVEDGGFERVERVERDEAVRRAVQRLGQDDRDIIALRYSADLSNVEIARVLGITPESARQRLTRARQRLKQTLDGDGWSRAR